MRRPAGLFLALAAMLQQTYTIKAQPSLPSVFTYPSKPRSGVRKTRNWRYYAIRLKKRRAKNRMAARSRSKNRL